MNQSLIHIMQKSILNKLFKLNIKSKTIMILEEYIEEHFHCLGEGEGYNF